MLFIDQGVDNALILHTQQIPAFIAAQPQLEEPGGGSHE
jgi:hypothetical protein